MNWKKFKLIVLPNIIWWCGYGLLDNLYSYYHLNIVKRPHYWQDADSSQCKRRWCRWCGKGKNK